MDVPSIRHALRGKMNALRLSTSILPDVEGDEALAFLQQMMTQTEQIVRLLDDMEAALDAADAEAKSEAEHAAPRPPPTDVDPGRRHDPAL